MSLYRIFNNFLIILALQISFTPLIQADESLSITSGRGQPFVNKQQTGFYDLIVKHMFERINVKAKTVLLPSERSLINANAGIDDGNIARIKGIEKKYPNLIRVPEKIIDFEFVAFTKKRHLKISKWEDLKLYNVAFINGWKVFEKKVVQYKSLVKASDSKQLFELIEKDRVDIVLYDLFSGVWYTKQNKNKIDYLRPPIASYQLYLYIHKKHKKLVPDLALALKAMKKDGSYQKIYSQTLQK